MIENYIWIVLFLFLFILTFLLGKKEEKTEKGQIVKDQIEQYIKELREYFDAILNRKLAVNTLGTAEHTKREHLRWELKTALGQCCLGDLKSKLYVKEHIKQWLLNQKKVEETQLDKIIPFNFPYKLSSKDKFDLLLYSFKKKYGTKAFHEMMNLFPEKTRLTNRELEELFYQQELILRFPDKLEIAVQRIYEQFLGLGTIDELRDMEIDGISCGVSKGLHENEIFHEREVFYKEEKIDKKKDRYEKESIYEKESTYGKENIYQKESVYGKENTYKKEEIKARKTEEGSEVWVFYQGSMTALGFLIVSSEEELERISRKVYRFGHPGQLSAQKGYMVSQMQDGSRVVVVRPPFAEGWSFFIRKFAAQKAHAISELFPDKGADKLYDLLECLIAGEQVSAVTGEQGAGKTTLLKTLISFIPENYTIRTQELVFELHLRELYPERNIVSFCETDEVNGREGLDLQKKTDGTVLIVGEVASAPVAGWLIMVAQTASRFTLFTHHAKTTDALVYSMRNDLLSTGIFQNESAAEAQVRSAIRFDIHIAKTGEGKRYIERITEILQEEKGKISRELLCFKNNSYHQTGTISVQISKEIKKQLSEEQKERFTDWFEGEKSLTYENGK